MQIRQDRSDWTLQDDFYRWQLISLADEAGIFKHFWKKSQILLYADLQVVGYFKVPLLYQNLLLQVGF